jgi:hypothetical protein
MSLLPVLRLVSRSILAGSVIALSFASFTLYLFFTAGGEINWLSAIKFFFVGLVLWMTGEMLCQLFKLTNTSIRAPLTLMLGTITISLVATSALIFRAQALVIFEIYSIIAVILFFFINKLLTNEAGFNEIAARGGIVDLCIPAILFALVAFWSTDLARTLPILKATYNLNAWTDYYIHATEISQLGSVFSAGRGSILLVGESIPFYHYAFLGVCSILAGLVDIPPLGLATAFLTPYGIFIMVCGAYIWGTLLVSRTTGILCALLVLFLPDASTYGFKNGFFSFHWLLVTSPGTGYAVGIVLTTCSLLYISYVERQRSALFLAIVTLFVVLFFRIHVFLLFLPSIVATIVFENESFKHYRRGIIFIVIGLSTISILILLLIPSVQSSWFDYSHVGDFLRFIHLDQNPTSYFDIAKWITTNISPFLAMLLGIVFVPVIALGALILVYPAVSVLCKTRSGPSYLDRLPIFLLISFVVMILITPSIPSGDITDLKHRSFPLLYVVFLLWSIVSLSHFFLERLKSYDAFLKFVLPAFMVGAVGISFISTTPPWIPIFAWGRTFYGTPVEKDLVSAALFVRTRRGPTDVVALLPTEPKSALSDRGTIFASLADTPIFLARYPIQKLHGRHRGLIADERMKFLNAIDLSNHNCGSFRMLARRGITWLVTYDVFKAASFPESFKSNHVSVYHIANVLNSSCGSR